jgi:tRNA A-37 threonylcarbamoyl transferase component Bud32/tetratricopeptide (TPR) repeat protein
MSRHDQLESLFLECAALPPGQREAYLDARCAGDPALKAEVLDLLARDTSPDTPSLPPFVAHPGPMLRPEDEPLPETIGPFRILRRLGEGGFGEVFEAEQERPVRRRVALKVLKAGMDTRAVLARFAAERQALALMDHPGIARVLDAGETGTGRPWFAMELVPGQQITDWCERTSAGMRTRIELMIEVCRAVEHAHQKGVIHRDLKASNILVSDSDGRPLPRVIDFGIAKATLPGPAEAASVHTRPEEFLGTPEYMSPEQAESGGMDVDTRTDVYSLGVVLYQLLTGRLPFASERLRGAGLDAVRRILKDEEPPRPSDAVPTGRSLRGDLDWIVLRAMEKDRSRRYASPALLADDLGRHLREEPVLAGPPTTGYRLWKLVRRRRGAVAAAAAVLLALAAGVAATAVQAIRATRAEEEARRQAGAAIAVNEFLTGMLGAGNPEANPGGHELTVREVIDRAAGELGDSTFANPVVEAGIRAALASTYLGLGRYRDALPQAERALALTERAGGDAATMFERQLLLARAQGLAGDRESAEARLAALADRAADPIGRSQYLHVRGGNLGTMGRLPEADSMLTESAALLRARHRAGGSHRSALVSILTDLSELKGLRGMLPECESLAREALAVTRERHGDEHHDVAVALGHLGSVMRRQGRYPAAESLYRAAAAIDRRVVGAQHPFVAYTLSNLGLTLSAQGRSGEAAAVHRDALAIITASIPGEHPDLVTVRNNLATSIQEQGRLDEALEMQLATLAMARRVLGTSSVPIGIYLNNIGSLYC